LSKCCLTAGDIDRVILSGGTARIPRLQKAVADIFPNAQMLSSISPDEVIALGAATQAGLLQEKWNPDEIRPQLKGTKCNTLRHRL
jgi:molecular chaperone DnaK (HSP70)